MLGMVLLFFFFGVCVCMFQRGKHTIKGVVLLLLGVHTGRGQTRGYIIS